mgnify:CR=1 FL=1
MASKYIKSGSFERELKKMQRPITTPKAANVAAQFKRVTGIKLTKTPKPKPVKV